MAVVVVISNVAGSRSAVASQLARTPKAPIATSVAATPPARVAPGTGIIRWGSSYKSASGYNRFQYVFVVRDDARSAAGLRGKSLVYASGTSIKTTWSTGVTYSEAAANGWLLTDQNGQPITTHEGSAYIADIGNPAYQRQFVENMKGFLSRNRNQGIFIDDVIAVSHGLISENVLPAKYPTDQAWEDAMVSFVGYVGPALKKLGYYVVVNAHKFIPGNQASNDGTLEAGFWKRLAPSVSGLMSEYWLQSPIDVAQLRQRGSRWDQNWTGWQGLESVAQGAGVDFFGLMYGSASDVRAMRYGRGTFLLDWDGRGGAFVYNMTDRSDPYDPSWMTDLGPALRPKFQRLPGVWQRRFERGIAIVNTTGSPVTVRVRGTLQTIAATDALFSANPPT